MQSNPIHGQKRHRSFDLDTERRLLTVFFIDWKKALELSMTHWSINWRYEELKFG